jgi:hypothetical protein
MSRGIIVHERVEFIRNQSAVIWETPEKIIGVSVNGCRVCAALWDHYKGSPGLL